MAEVRRSGADRIGDVHVELHPGLMGNGRQVQHAVGGAAKGHVHGQGVHKCLLGHDIPGPDIPAVHLHNLHARVLRQLNALRVHGRDGSISPKAHSQDLSQAVHAVGCVHAGAGPAGGAGLVLILLHVLLRHLSRRVGAYRLKHAGEAGLVALYMAGQHGAAADKHGGNIDPGRCHQKSRHILIAVGNHHQCVKLMGDGHTLRGIRDQIPGYQGVLHANVAHGNPVADRNGREHHRGASPHGHAQLHRLHDLVQIHMARHNLIVGADNAHQGLL